ncbi:MAG: 30S ribosomal protein S9 [Thermodesulfobacteriota bacterium]
MTSERYYATGKRKTAVARVWLLPGTGQMTVNKRPAQDYFPRVTLLRNMVKPLLLTGNLERFDVMANVRGGGIAGQADAVTHGIARALLKVSPELRLPLKKAGLLRRDAREKERKKYGQRGARARFQFSKR